MFSWLGLRRRNTTPQATAEAPDAKAADQPHAAAPGQAIKASIAPQQPADPDPVQPIPSQSQTLAEPAGTAGVTEHAQLRLQLEALFAANKIAEARQAFANLPDGLESQEWHARAGLMLARQSREHMATIRFASALRAAAPKQPLGYGAACIALRALGRGAEAEAIANAGLQACPNAPGFLEEAAQVAEANGDTDLAFERWSMLAERCPQTPAGILGAIRLSQRLQQPPKTEQLIAEALQAFPDAPDVLTMAARTATRQQRWDEADGHWRRLISSLPDDPSVRMEAATSLLTHQRGLQRRVPKALTQLAELNTRFPNYAPGFTAHLRALREASRLDEAESVGGAWRARFPDEVSLAMAWAEIAEDRQDFNQALARIEAIRAHVPPAGQIEAAYARALYLAGRTDEAELACTRALADFPVHPAVLAEHAGQATRRGDWAEALRRAEQAQALRPNDTAMQRLVRRAKAQTVGLAEAAEPAPENAAVEAAALLDSTAAFFSRFESLGATSAGCEFGLVQRHFGAEPLGLLRWANIQPEGLIEGLNSGFTALGAEGGSTRLVVKRVSAAYQEYFIQDKRYGFWGHTFVKVEDSPYDRMLTQSLRRMRFLGGKLKQDLEACEKIFVYKFSLSPDLTVIDQIYTALCKCGSASLLCMTLADDAHPPGTLRMLKPGLFVGAASMFMDSVGGADRGIDTDNWRLLCEQVAHWHDANRKDQNASVDQHVHQSVLED